MKGKVLEDKGPDWNINVQSEQSHFALSTSLARILDYTNGQRHGESRPIPESDIKPNFGHFVELT